MSPPPDEAPPPIPFVILTGFLGAGKTTLLNRLLGAQHHRRVAVIVNELGKIDIDAGLVRSRANDVLELSGGCVCHQVGVQRELWSALDDVVHRSHPDAVILETSGIAEPAEIIRGLAAWQSGAPQTPEDDAGDHHDDKARRLTISSIITVVDAQAGADHLARFPEGREQVVCADRIVLSKTELASPTTLAILHGVLATLNANAERVAFPPGPEGTAVLLPWFFEPAERDTPAASAAAARGDTAAGVHGDAQDPRRHDHDLAHQLSAASYVDEVPLVAEALLMACRGFGRRLVRAKGWVHVVGDDRRGFLEVAGLRTELHFGEPWTAGEPRITRLVLIGEGVDDATVRRQLWACRASVNGGAQRGQP